MIAECGDTTRTREADCEAAGALKLTKRTGPVAGESCRGVGGVAEEERSRNAGNRALLGIMSPYDPLLASRCALERYCSFFDNGRGVVLRTSLAARRRARARRSLSTFTTESGTTSHSCAVWH